MFDKIIDYRFNEIRKERNFKRLNFFTWHLINIYMKSFKEIYIIIIFYELTSTNPAIWMIFP